MLLVCIVVAGGSSFIARSALAWGDEGHKIVTLIAEHYLDPAARARVSAMLAADTDNLTAHNIADAATWADKYRDSDRNGAKERYVATRQWHFVDIELADPDLDRVLRTPGVASERGRIQGAADGLHRRQDRSICRRTCGPATNPEERLIALKFLLHLVGDLHQPLHTADDHDAGGNRKRVTADGFRPGNLHHFWDTEFVERLGRDPQQVAAGLIAQTTDVQGQVWSQGTAADWAKETFALGRDAAG
jgi:hypothetical protein